MWEQKIVIIRAACCCWIISVSWKAVSYRLCLAAPAQWQFHKTLLQHWDIERDTCDGRSKEHNNTDCCHAAKILPSSFGIFFKNKGIEEFERGNISRNDECFTGAYSRKVSGSKKVNLSGGLYYDHSFPVYYPVDMKCMGKLSYYMIYRNKLLSKETVLLHKMHTAQ